MASVLRTSSTHTPAAEFLVKSLPLNGVKYHHKSDIMALGNLSQILILFILI